MDATLDTGFKYPFWGGDRASMKWLYFKTAILIISSTKAGSTTRRSILRPISSWGDAVQEKRRSQIF